MIRWPIEPIAAYPPGARLIRINRDDAGVPASLADRAASLDGDAAELTHHMVTTGRTTS